MTINPQITQLIKVREQKKKNRERDPQRGGVASGKLRTGKRTERREQKIKMAMTKR